MFNTVRKYRQCKITISDEDTVLIKNLYQFGECCSRRIETDFFWRKSGQGKDHTLHWKRFGKQEAPTTVTRAVDQSTRVLKRT